MDELLGDELLGHDQLQLVKVGPLLLGQDWNGLQVPVTVGSDDFRGRRGEEEGWAWLNHNRGYTKKANNTQTHMYEQRQQQQATSSLQISCKCNNRWQLVSIA